MTATPWPLFDLRIDVDGVLLRVMTEADVAPLAAALPDDVELNPAANALPGLDARSNRSLVVAQIYWASWANWRVDSWELPLVVEADGELVGLQTVEGEDFPKLRTVDSSSWLVQSARGRGIGRAARTGAVALAFGPLGAHVAISSAWHDNHASLAVSRALGYQPNGEHLHRRGDGVDRMVHVRLTRDDWAASGRGEGVQISGFEKCRPWFGV